MCRYPVILNSMVLIMSEHPLLNVQNYVGIETSQ